MTIYINEEDKKLFEQNGFNQESVGETVNHYRSQGLSDDDIQAKINQRLEGWRTPKQDVKTDYTYPNQDINGISPENFKKNIDSIYNIPQVPMPPRNNAGYTNSDGEVRSSLPTFAENHPVVDSILNRIKQMPSNIADFNNKIGGIGNQSQNINTARGFVAPQHQPNGTPLLTGGVSKKSFLNDQRYWLKTKANKAGDALLRIASNMGNSNPYGNLQPVQSPVKTTVNENGQKVIDYSKESPMEMKVAGSRADYETLKDIRRNPDNYFKPVHTDKDYEAIKTSLQNGSMSYEAAKNSWDKYNAENLIQKQKADNAARVLTEDAQRKIRNLEIGEKVLDAGLWGTIALNVLTGGGASIPTVGGKVVTSTLKNNIKKEMMSKLIAEGFVKKDAELLVAKAAEQGIVDKGVQLGLENYSKNLMLGDLGGKVATNAMLGGATGMIDVGLLGTGLNEYAKYLGVSDTPTAEAAVNSMGAGALGGAALAGGATVLSPVAAALGKIPLYRTYEPLPNAVAKYTGKPYQSGMNYMFKPDTDFVMGEGSNLRYPNRESQDVQYNGAEQLKQIAPKTMEKLESNPINEYKPKQYKVVDGKTVEVLEDGSYRELPNKYSKIAPNIVASKEARESAKNQRVENTGNLQANETAGQKGNTADDKEWQETLKKRDAVDLEIVARAASTKYGKKYGMREIKMLIGAMRKGNTYKNGLHKRAEKFFEFISQPDDRITSGDNVTTIPNAIDFYSDNMTNEEIINQAINNLLYNRTKPIDPMEEYYKEIQNNIENARKKISEAGENAYDVFENESNTLIDRYSNEDFTDTVSELAKLADDTVNKSLYNQNKGVENNEREGSIDESDGNDGKEISEYDSGSESGSNGTTSRESEMGMREESSSQVALEGLEEESAKAVQKQQDEVTAKENKEKYSTTQDGKQNQMFNVEQFKNGQQMLFDTSDMPKEPEVKKTTYTMKSGKSKEIEYVEEIPEGYIEDKGATTAPKGYTWYHNNKSITSGERKRILVKDKAAEENSEVEKDINVPSKKSEPKKKEVSEKSDKYEDYGEKIHGARKDIWQSYNEILAKKLPETYEEFTKTKLSDVFPDINGEKFIENGGNSDTMTVIKLLRDSIPTKPSGRKAMMQHYRKEWTDAIKEHREYTQKLLDGEMTADEAVNKLVYNEKRIDFDLKRKADAYRAVGYPACKNIKGYMLDKGGVSVKDSETGEYRKEERWYITRENRFGLIPFKTREEAVDYLKAIAGAKSTPAKREARLEIGRWSDERKANGYMIYYKAGTGKYIELKNKFETAKEAKEYLNEHKEELLEQLNKLKEEPPMRGEVNEPRIGKGFRKGKNVNPEEFSKTFGFRGIQFGNYVEGTKRIEDINNAYDSLMDMSEVLNIPEKAISLNGELGLAFGARGKGGKHAASAHYEPVQVVINLTKNKGAGSLAHEWWHALDNYFGKKNNSEMATETYGTRTSEFREEMAKAYSDVKSAVRKAIYSRSKELDKTRSKDYWSTDVEMTARAFETYIKHKIDSQGFSNDYLANIIGENIYKNLGREDAYPYPTKAEMPEIEKAFDNFFKTIKTRETDKGVELYNEEFNPVKPITDLISNVNKYFETKEAFKNGSNFEDLSNNNEIFNAIRKELENRTDYNGNTLFEHIKDYIFTDMVKANKTPNRFGLHVGKDKAIYINTDAIEALPQNEQTGRFINTVRHEIEHAIQEKQHNDIIETRGLKNSELKIFDSLAKELVKEKPSSKIISTLNNMINKIANKRNLRNYEVEALKDYAELKVVNKQKSEYYNKHKDVLAEWAGKTIGKTKVEARKVYNKLKPSQKIIVDNYTRLFNNYYDAKYEANARKTGEAKAKEVINANNGRTTLQLPRLSKQRNVRTRPQSGTPSEEFGETSEEFEGFGETKAAVNKNTSDEINQVVRDKVYDWHGNLESDRYDVDKSLNSFIQLTKHKAKNLSQKTGIKISDKQLREILPFLRERTGFPKSLERDDLRTIFNKLSGEDKAELAKLADSISDKFEKYYTNYKDAKGEQTEESVENHISHIWDLDDKKKSLLTNYITTNSKFAKQRTIGTFAEGIDGIEINGKKVQLKPKTLDYAEILKSSSDNLIKATHDSILANEIKNLRYHGEPMVLPAAKAPNEWIEVSHPALNKAVYMGSVGEDELPMIIKTPVKVHPEIADYVKAVFEVQKTSKFWDTFDSLNGMIKQALLGFSGFHGYALSESSIGNTGVMKTLKELNPKKFVDAIKNGNYDVYKNEEAAKRAIKAGVQLGTPSDLQRNLVEDTLKKIPLVGKYVAGAVSWNNKVLWDVLHNNFKILAFNTAVENLGGNVTKEQERAIAQWVNDSFGGQAWELLGIKKSSVKAASRVLLSPDWNFSTIRQAAAAINSEWIDDLLSQKGGKRLGKVLGLGEEIGSKGARGKIGRGFWMRSALFFTVFYNLINAAFRDKDRKEHPDLYPDEMTPMDYSIWSNSYPMDGIYDRIMPKVFIGRNSDGTARMLRVGKQFREVPEFITEPISKLGGKTSPLINVASQVGLGMSTGDAVNMWYGGEPYRNQDIWEGYGEDAERKEGVELALGMAKALGKSLTPFIATKYIGGKHEPSAWDFFAQTNAGGSKSKVFKQVKEALKAGKPDVIEDIERKAYQDGVPVEDIESMVEYAQNNYKAENTKKYKKILIKSFENNDVKEYDRIVKKMAKKHLPESEQRRLREKAWEAFEKGK